MPITLQYLDYSSVELMSLFSTIENQPWAMFLQSAAKDHPDNRFDIIVADPMATLCHWQGQNTLHYKEGLTSTNHQDPFDVLQTMLKTLLPPLPSLAPWPFLGGALGYFSYDLARQIESIPEIAQDDIDIPDMAIGIYDWALIADHKEKKLILIQPKGHDRLAWLKAQHASEQPHFLRTDQWQANMTYAQYHEKFDAIQAHILAGDCYQINLAQRFEAPFVGSEWEAYQRLSKENATPFSGFLRIDSLAILSLSPERFLQLRGKQIETKPIKGTRPRSLDPMIDAKNAADLQQTEKDRAENVMIVDLLRNDIGKIAIPGTVNVPTLFQIESFPAVHHLVSTVVGELSEDKDATDLLRACFPGGSITGAPKIRAMEIIESLEPNRRNVYCGSIGYLSRCGAMDTNISIRTLVCHQGRMYAWAGGAIVADSQVGSEYQETIDKLSKILPLL